MPRPDERELAARLARALDGDPSAEPDVAGLAVLLERATEPDRFELSEAEVETALAAARTRLESRGARRKRPPRIALAFAAAVAAAVVVLVVTFVQLPGVDVEGKALAALETGRILRLDERITPARRGTFPPSERLTWIDSREGRLYSIQLVRGEAAEITLVEPGRAVRYEPQRNLIVTGRDCRALEGCPLDPILLYRRALHDPRARSREVELRGLKVYRITLPVQELPGAVSVRQEALVDAKTFLPLRITWLERRGTGPFRPASTIEITSVKRIRRDSPELQGVFQVLPGEGTRVEQRLSSGHPLRLLGVRRLTSAEAARVNPPLRWLGSAFDGRKLQRLEEVRWNAGRAYRLRYRGLTVWNYTSVIPPDLVVGRLSAAVKTVPFLHGVARFYGSRSGHLVLELDVAGRSVAVVAPDLYKAQLLRVLRALKPLR